MQSEYQKFRILVLATLLLVIISLSSAQGRWNYNDVDLRIAERQAIPHYIRHGFEYPDIDIRSIMRQRGLLPQSNHNSNSHNNNNNNNRAFSNHNRPVHYRSSNGKSFHAMSNHLDDSKKSLSKKSKLMHSNKYNSKYYSGKYKKQRFG